MSEAGRPNKCSVTVSDNGAKSVSPCWAMEDHMDAPYGRGTKAQGISQPYLINMKTGEHSRSPIVFKGGKHAKGGTMMNYCPWCGSDIKTYEEEE